MNITEQGGIKSPVPGTQAIIDLLRGTRRFSISPLDYADQNGNLLGHYRVSANTGAATGIAAGGLLASCRWTDSHAFMVPLKISWGAAVTTVASPAAPLDCELISARAWATGDTGGTQIYPLIAATNSQKNRACMGNSLVANLAISTTAALGAGATKTLDSQGMGITPLRITTTALGSADMVDLYKWDVLGQHPLVYGQNEGWNIRARIVFPTSLVITGYLTYEWAELAFF